MSRQKKMNQAYRSAIAEGKTKEEAKEVKKEAERQYWQRESGRVRPGGSGKAYEFDDDLNGNGTHWHTSDDL